MSRSYKKFQRKKKFINSNERRSEVRKEKRKIKKNISSYDNEILEDELVKK